MLIFDAHLDLSRNAMEWNRDLTQTVAHINAREAGLADKPDRGRAVVSIPELRRGNIGLIVATQIARVVTPGSPLPGWLSPAQAWAQTQGQLAWYRAMEKAGQLRMIRDRDTLDSHLREWALPTNPPQAPVDFILSLEAPVKGSPRHPLTRKSNTSAGPASHVLSRRGLTGCPRKRMS